MMRVRECQPYDRRLRVALRNTLAFCALWLALADSLLCIIHCHMYLPAFIRSHSFGVAATDHYATVSHYYCDLVSDSGDTPAPMPPSHLFDSILLLGVLFCMNLQPLAQLIMLPLPRLAVLAFAPPYPPPR